MEQGKKKTGTKKKKVLAEIGDIQSYVNLVLENAKLGDSIYRGHASKDWELKPSIGRIDGYEKMVFLDADSNLKMPRSIDEVFKNIEGARFVIPNYTDARYKNQKALFLLSDKPYKKITFITDSYIIKRECKQQILRDLAKLGYDRSLVYLLLDSLCEDIKKEYGLK